VLFSLYVHLPLLGGPDKAYVFVEKEDMRPAHLPNVQYLIRGVHVSTDKTDNQTINFVVSSVSGTPGTLFKAFSNSIVLDSYCDGGQNYKNLVAFVKGLRQDFKQRTVAGCTINHKAP
jgi:hypothetical protein